MRGTVPLLLAFVLLCRPLPPLQGALFTPLHYTSVGTSSIQSDDDSLLNILGCSEKYRLRAQTNRSSDDSTIDVGLYSRQLLVYGKSAQNKMQHAHVLIVGDGHLANEVAKNIALSGIGRISLHSTDGLTTFQTGLSSCPGRVSITGQDNGDDSLLSYTKSLNLHNQVRECLTMTIAAAPSASSHYCSCPHHFHYFTPPG